MLYKILQYGKVIFSHEAGEMTTAKVARQIAKDIVDKAKKFIKQDKMKCGMFDVDVYRNGEVIDSFLSGTDYTY